MVSQGVMLTFSAVILCTIFHQASSLMCYECTSLLDEKCGKTWGYGPNDEEAKKYLKECEGTSVSCQKIENEGQMEGKAVTRGCWKSTSVEEYTPEKKCMDMHNGMVCYCASDNDEPCNGKQLLQPQIAVILLGLSFLLRRFVL